MFEKASNATQWPAESKAPEAESRPTSGRPDLGSIPIGLAHLIHEITSPLTNLSITLQLCGRRIAKTGGNTDALVLTMLEEMTREVDRMHTLISSVRSHIQTLWQSGVTFESLDLKQLMNRLLEGERQRYVAQGVRVDADFSPDLPAFNGNEHLLSQALLNLLKNAVEAMPQGGTLNIRAYLQDNSIVLEIIDTGIGIPADLDVFAPFATSKPDGMGLGLTIAHNIVNLHGGKIAFISQAGKGSTFRISFPGTPKAELKTEAREDDQESFRFAPHGSPGRQGEAS